MIAYFQLSSFSFSTCKFVSFLVCVSSNANECNRFTVFYQEHSVRLRSVSVTPAPVGTMAHALTWLATMNVNVPQVCWPITRTRVLCSDICISCGVRQQQRVFAFVCSECGVRSSARAPLAKPKVIILRQQGFQTETHSAWRPEAARVNIILPMNHISLTKIVQHLLLLSSSSWVFNKKKKNMKYFSCNGDFACTMCMVKWDFI